MKTFNNHISRFKPGAAAFWEAGSGRGMIELEKFIEVRRKPDWSPSGQAIVAGFDSSFHEQRDYDKQCVREGCGKTLSRYNNGRLCYACERTRP